MTKNEIRDIVTLKKCVFSGTLGDAFMVLCKLYGKHKRTGEHFQVTRLSKHPQMDGVIKSLFETVSFAEYKTPCIEVENAEELKLKLSNIQDIYINTVWSGMALGRPKADPQGYPMEPFPQLTLPRITLENSKFKLGIQLHSGKLNSNFRGFSLGWISKVRRKLLTDRIEIYLLGTGQGYCPQRIQRFCEKHKISNLVGQTEFSEWLACIRAMDLFITMEGFSAFFAMSQKVPTVLYNQYRHGIDGSIHPAWRQNSILININSNRLLNKIRHLRIKYLKQRNLYSPRISQPVRNFINLNLLEDTIHE